MVGLPLLSSSRASCFDEHLQYLGTGFSCSRAMLGFGYSSSSRIKRCRGSKVAAAMMMVAFLSPTARVEAFTVFARSGIASRTLRDSRAVRQSGAAEVARRRPKDDEDTKNTMENIQEIQHEKQARSFFDRIGSPRYIAAPMVEHSEAAFRYLVRRHGTQLAYTQMIHAGRFAPDQADAAVEPCARRRLSPGKFREQRFDGVDEPEDRPLVVQFCGNDPDILVQAARHVEARVDAVDLNLGCPQRIARKGNYGAFLLPNAELCERIIATMSRDLSVPVTAKIRALEKDEDTLDLAKRLEGAGAQLLTAIGLKPTHVPGDADALDCPVHGRTVRQAKTTQGAANWDIIRRVKEAVSIPVVANGGVQTRADAERLLEATGADAVMSSEGLLEDPSLFDARLTPLDELKGIEVAHRLLSLALEYMELARRFPTQIVSIKGHLFKIMFRLLTCNHDLRDRLAGRTADADSAQDVVNEICQRYYLDPISRAPTEDLASVPAVPVAPRCWYRRHRDDAADDNYLSP